MLLLKLLQAIVKALNSAGTPRQVAAGMAFGAALGLTPIGNLHNLIIVLVALILNISLAGFTLGWSICVPLGFALDPLFDAIGKALLGAPGLTPLWTRLANMPVMPFTSFNNSVVLGSLVFWIVMWLPIYFLSRWLVIRYRATLYERLKKTSVFKAISASRLYQAWHLFQAP